MRSNLKYIPYIYVFFGWKPWLPTGCTSAWNKLNNSDFISALIASKWIIAAAAGRRGRYWSSSCRLKSRHRAAGPTGSSGGETGGSMSAMEPLVAQPPCPGFVVFPKGECWCGSCWCLHGGSADILDAWAPRRCPSILLFTPLLCPSASASCVFHGVPQLLCNVFAKCNVRLTARPEPKYVEDLKIISYPKHTRGRFQLDGQSSTRLMCTFLSCCLAAGEESWCHLSKTCCC